MFFPAHSWRINIVKSFCDQEVVCSALVRQGSNFEFQKLLPAQPSLYMHKCGLKLHFISFLNARAEDKPGISDSQSRHILTTAAHTQNTEYKKNK